MQKPYACWSGSIRNCRRGPARGGVWEGGGRRKVGAFLGLKLAQALSFPVTFSKLHSLPLSPLSLHACYQNLERSRRALHRLHQGETNNPFRECADYGKQSG